MPFLVQFPNAFGLTLPQRADAVAAQQRYGFSDALRDFLLTQNGFDFEAEANPTPAQAPDWPPRPDADPDGCAELRYLYGLNAAAEYLDLDSNAQGHALFAGVFMPMGVDYGGNLIVEVLAGSRKGWIGSLDHEMFASSDDLDDLAEQLELDCAGDSSPDEKAEALCDDDLGLVWWHASSLTQFLAQCVYLDDSGSGFVVDAVQEVGTEPTGGA